MARLPAGGPRRDPRGAVTGVTSVAAVHGDEEPEYVGNSWRVVAVQRHGDPAMHVPGDPDEHGRPRIDFGRDKMIALFDGVVPISGTYELAGDRLTIRDAAAGAILYVGDDPLQVALIDTMQELALRPAGAPAAAAVRMAAPGQLTVSTTHYTLAAEPIGPVPVLPRPQPTHLPLDDQLI